MIECYEKYKLLTILNKKNENEIKNKKTKISYLNIPCAFDIETSSFYNEYDEKTAIMYIWQFGIYDYICYGRTYQEFIELLETLQNFFRLSEKRILICFVHNLSYEFMFIHKWLEWKKVFALDRYKVAYALSIYNIEFRCSYLESGYSLENLGKSLVKYPINKLVGNLNYNLIRHSKTPLTQTELDYCEYDIKIILNYIKEKLETDDITNIKITKTSYVRNYLRQCCFNGIDKKGNWNRLQYNKIIKNLTLGSVYFYELCKHTFLGGFAHANYFNAGQILHNVVSFDKTSDYPSIMVSEQFPMSSFKRIYLKSYSEFENYLKKYCCIFIIELEDVTTCDNFNFDNYISKSSKLYEIKGEVLNNGRVISAEKITIGVTEIDFEIINMNYNYKGKGKTITILDFWIARKGYLPRNFILGILQLYKNKTEYKGIDEKKAEYQKSKEMLNSTYGMIVTDPVQRTIEYNKNSIDCWYISEDKTLEEYIKKYDTDKNRFTFFPWGIYVTAYARLYIWRAISEIKEKYVYSDTDSIKFIKSNDLMEYFKKDNEYTIFKLKKSAEYNKIPFELFKPKNLKGEEQILGLWDFEGEYNLFKTLGSKRYIFTKSLDKKLKEDIEKNPHKIALEKGYLSQEEINTLNKNELKKYLNYFFEFNITISGLHKSLGKKYLLQKFKFDYNKIFSAFNSELEVPKEFSGRNTHTYINEQRHGFITDYMNEMYEYFEQSGIHLENATFTMHIGEYINLLQHIIFGFKP